MPHGQCWVIYFSAGAFAVASGSLLSIIDLILSPPSLRTQHVFISRSLFPYDGVFSAVTLEQILARFFASLPSRCCRVGISSCLPERASCVFMSCSPLSLPVLPMGEYYRNSGEGRVL